MAVRGAAREMEDPHTQRWPARCALLRSSRPVAFYPSKVSRSLDSVVRVKAIWSTNNRRNIITCLAD